MKARVVHHRSSTPKHLATTVTGNVLLEGTGAATTLVGVVVIDDDAAAVSAAPIAEQQQRRRPPPQQPSRNHDCPGPCRRKDRRGGRSQLASREGRRRQRPVLWIVVVVGAVAVAVACSIAYVAVAESGFHDPTYYYRLFLLSSSPSTTSSSVPAKAAHFAREGGSNGATKSATPSDRRSAAEETALGRMADDQLWRMGDSLPYDLGVNSKKQASSSPPSYLNCSIHYQGVLLIRQTDLLGGAGTALLQLVLGQLLYAAEHRLVPWIHLDNSSHVVYDPVVHAQRIPNPISRRRATTTTTPTPIRVVTNVTWVRRSIQYRHPREATPGPPHWGKINEVDGYWTSLADLVKSTGTDGIWDHYFEPVNPHRLAEDTCETHQSSSSSSLLSAAKLPHVTLPLYLITPGLHGYSVRHATQAWRYEYLPSYVTQPHLLLHTWLEPRRVRAHQALQQYVEFRPHLHELARRVNPDCTMDRSCLGLHIRHSDKAAGRRIVPVHEFLPFVVAYLRNGGQHVYVATDSTIVWDEIQREWPDFVKDRLRALHITSSTAKSKHSPNSAIHRSSDHRAVFDLMKGNNPSSGSDHGPSPRRFHHDTNQQALVEILALSRCQFLVHGLSAMSEAAIWVNLALHNASVNLEADTDEDEELRWTPDLFGEMVRRAVMGEPSTSWPHPSNRLKDWWNDVSNAETSGTAVGESRGTSASQSKVLNDPCLDYEGVLHIRSVRKGATSASAFFIDAANQLLYAEKYRLLPVVHLDPNDAELIHDPAAHKVSHRNQHFLFTRNRNVLGAPLVPSTNDTQDGQHLIPGKPHLIPGVRWNATAVTGSGIWDDYFEPLHNTTNLNHFPFCQSLPVLTLSRAHVTSLALHAPWALRAWRYDGVPSAAWERERWLATIPTTRRTGHETVERYYRFRPYLLRRAAEINPLPAGNQGLTCLAVHIRVGPKAGTHRAIVKADAYLPYLEAFVRGGGERIYVSTDSHRALRFVQSSSFPEAVRSRIRSSGRYVVRSQLSSPSMDSLPTRLLENHHRVNAETIADILAMARCDLLLHSYSSVAEAVVYVNRRLALEPNRTINLELLESHRASPAAFEEQTRQLVKR